MDHPPRVLEHLLARQLIKLVTKRAIQFKGFGAHTINLPKSIDRCDPFVFSRPENGWEHG
jgi:hypothetical protein